MNPFSDTPSAVAGGTCAVCGERPGTLRVVASDGVQRRAATVCEPCANRLMAAQAQGAPLGVQPTAQPGPDAPQSETPTLDQFGRDLTDEARNGRIDPVIGRAAEIEQTVEILARRRKNNAVLIGEAGVGKTAIVEGLARRIAEGDVPATLLGVRLVALDLAGMVAGAQFRGQFEERLKTALAEVAQGRGPDRAVHRRGPHDPRRRQRRGRDGRREHAQADARPRRAADGRRHDAGRVPQDRARRRARPPLLAGDGRGAVGRGDRRDPARPAERVRGAPRRDDRRRGAARRGAAERPLHPRVPPAGQGDRPDRPGRREGAAAHRRRARHGEARGRARAARGREAGRGRRRGLRGRGADQGPPRADRAAPGRGRRPRRPSWARPTSRP